MAGDDRIGPGHVCLYLAIRECGEREGATGLFYIRREVLMRLAKLKGKTTYFRIMGDLARFGYIDYEPSAHHGGGGR